MKYLSIFLILVFTCSDLFGATKKSIIRSQIKINEELNRLTSAKFKIENETKHMKEKLDNKYYFVEQYQQEWDESVGGFMGFFERKGDPDIKKKLDRAREDYRKTKNKLINKLNANFHTLKNVDIAITKNEAELLGLDNTKKQRETNLRNQIKHLKLTASFSKLEDNIDSMDDALNKVSEKYDKSIVGAYIRDKISGLLNSKAFCSAQKSCSKATFSEVEPHEIRLELFPESFKNKSRNTHKSKNK